MATEKKDQEQVEEEGEEEAGVVAEVGVGLTTAATMAAMARRQQHRFVPGA